MRADPADGTMKQTGLSRLVPPDPIPEDQAWFWTERWQAMEREADEDIAAGRVSPAMDVDEFIESLKSAANPKAAPR